MKKTIAVLISALLVLSLFAACGKQPVQQPDPTEPANDTAKLNVVCSIFPPYDFVRTIAGDKVDLTLLLDSKTDLHSYSPTADDIMKISQADLFVNIGGESDDWAEDVIASAANENLKVVSLIDLVNAVEEEALPGMQEEEEEHEEEEGPEYDEHVWTSLKNVIMIVPALTDTLCELDAANADFYRANSTGYLQSLQALETQYAETIGAAARKTLLFADRFPFRYLADDYDLTCYAAFSGCSAETEASFETMTMLVDTVKEQNLPYILMIDGSDGSVAESVSRQSGAEIRVLNSCQSVSADDIAAGATYLSIMNDNLQIINEVLN